MQEKGLFMQPNTYEDWLAVSRERQEDARALLSSRKTSVGPVYIAGYAVEASLKAFLRRLNKSIPRRGEEGHNLKGLWKQAGFSLRDIKDESGEKSFFVKDWNTALRYETSLEQVNIFDSESLVKAAGELAGWIQTQIRRKNRRRGKL
jgi:HEPN domain-containing protein